LNAVKVGGHDFRPLRVAPFCGKLPVLCRDLQHYRRARQWAKKHNKSMLDFVPLTIAPTWVHQGDCRFDCDEAELEPKEDCDNADRASKNLRSEEVPWAAL
jgi:hypothetical protein